MTEIKKKVRKKKSDVDYALVKEERRRRRTKQMTRRKVFAFIDF